MKRIIGWIVVIWLGLAAVMNFRSLPGHLLNLLRDFSLVKLGATIAFYLPSILILLGVYWFSKKFLLQKLVNEELKQIPRSKKDLLQVLDSLDSLFKSESSFELVKNEVRGIYKNSSKETIDSSFSKGLTPKEVCLYSIQAVCERQLASGHHHIYRGTLSPSGYSLKAIFNKSIDELIKLEFCTAEEANQKRKDLEVYIKEVG